jgi:hypothetical protein
MVSVPLRGAPALAVAVNVTVPFPEPDEPLAIVSHAAVVDALHPQVPAVATVMVGPVPPVAGTDAEVGLTL